MDRNVRVTSTSRPANGAPPPGRGTDASSPDLHGAGGVHAEVGAEREGISRRGQAPVVHAHLGSGGGDERADRVGEGGGVGGSLRLRRSAGDGGEDEEGGEGAQGALMEVRGCGKARPRSLGAPSEAVQRPAALDRARVSYSVGTLSTHVIPTACSPYSGFSRSSVLRAIPSCSAGGTGNWRSRRPRWRRLRSASTGPGRARVAAGRGAFRLHRVRADRGGRARGPDRDPGLLHRRRDLLRRARVGHASRTHHGAPGGAGPGGVRGRLRPHHARHLRRQAPGVRVLREPLGLQTDGLWIEGLRRGGGVEGVEAAEVVEGAEGGVEVEGAVAAGPGSPSTSPQLHLRVGRAPDRRRLDRGDEDPLRVHPFPLGAGCRIGASQVARETRSNGHKQSWRR